MSRFLLVVCRCVVLVAAGLPLFTGCSRGPAAPPFKPVADVKQLMQGAIDPSADVIWDATGWIDTASGTEERRPRSQAEWNTVRNSAIVLTEAGNLLMMVPRAKDGGEWMKRSQELIDTGFAAWKAADARNVNALFTVGGDIYEACSHCHQQYMDAIRNANQ
jgi:hypothetical protein